MSTIDDLTTPLSVDDVRNSIYTVLSTIGVDVTTWKKGSVLRTVITACSIVIAALSRLVSNIAKLGFLSLSSGLWLRLVAKYTFGVDYLAATFATGTVTLNNTGGGVYGPFAPFAVTFSASSTGKTYQNTAAFSVGALQTGVIVAVQAVEAGSASSIAAGGIDTCPLLAVTCSNVSALVGTDDESEGALQARSLEKLGSLSPNGPWDAYAFVGRSAGFDLNGNPVIITANTSGASFGVTRFNYSKDGIGGVDLYYATASGGVTGVVTDATTPLGAIQTLVNQYAEPLAITARVHSASPVVVPVGFEIWLYQNSATDAQIIAAASAVLATFLSARAVGGDVISGVGAVWSSALAAILGTLSVNGAPLPIFRISVPQADYILGVHQVPTLGVVTAIGIHREPRVTV